MSWLRLWHDMPTDPKWRVIARKANRPIAEVIAVFNFMLVNASANATERNANATERGVLHNWSDEDIAAALDVEIDAITSIRSAMQGKILDGDKISGWEKRQPKREDNSAGRAKEWRDEQKRLKECERNRTQPNAVKRPDIDADTDIATQESAGAFQQIFDAGCAVNSSLMTKSTAVIHQWLADGITPQDAVPEIQRIGKEARSWTYFTGAIADAKATRETPIPKGKSHAAPGRYSPDNKPTKDERAKASVVAGLQEFRSNNPPG